jgi:HPt (histidine-containing phosphotransfer) domain-containing protein
MFVKSGEAALAELTAAAQRDDAAAVQAQAHRFKGSAGNIGAVDLSTLCEQLESLGRDRRLDGVDELLGRLRSEFEACRTALAQLTER